jgi:AraC-like DNA-binding protein
MILGEVMTFVALLTRDARVRAAVNGSVGFGGSATAQTWDRLVWLVRERPVTGVVLDTESLPDGTPPDWAVGELRRRFPSVATVLIARGGADPFSLFRLGRAGLGGLVLLPADAVEGVGATLRHALGVSTEAVVARALSPYVPAREAHAVRMALLGAQRGWTSEELASHLGLSRPHASVRLRTRGLPSLGHVLVWAKLLHAGRWLMDPGRTAESVSRQLGYSSGAAFRRALRSYTSLTPSDVRALGGLRLVLSRFLDECGLPSTLDGDRSVA